jgi:hypothetical protein
MAAATATVVVASDDLPESVLFRHAGPDADFVLASSSNNSDGKSHNKTRTAATSTDTSTQAPVPLAISDKEPKNGENFASINPAESKCLIVGIKVQQRYIQLCHANTCKSDNNCPSDLNCPKMKLLCSHIVGCRRNSGGHPGCRFSVTLLSFATFDVVMTVLAVRCVFPPAMARHRSLLRQCLQPRSPS